ncbi:MAG TPA: hypothetical protein VMZ71_07520, partial [Gemmataceae bacterium]|nr:hypothetical protein [Gemmataceae bacterium]
AITQALRAADGEIPLVKLYRLSGAAQQHAFTLRGSVSHSYAEAHAQTVARLLNPDLNEVERSHWQLSNPPRELRPNELRSFNEWCRMSVELVRCVFGNPFTRVEFDPRWRTSTAVAIARRCHETGDYSAMPILADALQDADCADDFVTHCRAATHARGCRVVDAILELR